MKNMFYKIRSKKGFADIPAIFCGIVLLFGVLAFSIETYGALVLKSNLQTISNETARYIEFEGQINSSVDTEFKRVCNSVNVDNATMSVDGVFITGTKKLQLRSEFIVTAQASTSIFKIPFKLSNKSTGRSEVYHK